MQVKLFLKRVICNICEIGKERVCRAGMRIMDSIATSRLQNDNAESVILEPLILGEAFHAFYPGFRAGG